MLPLLLLSILAAGTAWCAASVRGARPPALLLVQIGLSLAVECIGADLSIQGVNNHWLYSVYFVAEAGLLSTLALQYLWPERAMHTGAVASGAYLIAAVVEHRAHPDEVTADTYIVGAFVLCVLYTAVLFRTATRTDLPLHGLPRAWVALSMVLWFGGSIPYNGLVTYLNRTDQALAERLYPINEWLCLARYGLLTVGLGVYLRPQWAARNT